MRLLLPTLLLLAPLVTAQKQAAAPTNYTLEVDGKPQAISRFERSSLTLGPNGRIDDLLLRPSNRIAKLQLPLLPGAEAQAWIVAALAGPTPSRNLRILEIGANGEIALAHTLDSAFFNSIELPAISVGEPVPGWSLELFSNHLGYAVGGKAAASVAKPKPGVTGFHLQFEGIDTSHVRTVGPLIVDFPSTPDSAVPRPAGPPLRKLKLVVEGSDPRPWLGLIEETRLQKPARNASLELFGANGSEVLVRVNLGGLTLTALNRDGVAPGSGLAPAFVVDFNVASVSVQFSSK